MRILRRVSWHSGGLNSSDTLECELELGDNAYPGISELKDITNQRGSSFLLLNVRSLLSKIAEIKLILNKYKGIQMLAVTETHLSIQVHDSEIAIDGYTIFRKDRYLGQGGSVLVYIAEDISALRRNDLELGLVEGIWIEILIPKSKSLLVGAVYCPPIGSNYLHPEFNAEIKESLDNAIAEEKEVIILGYLNANFQPNKRSQGVTKDLKSTFKSLNLTQIIRNSTRIS